MPADSKSSATAIRQFAEVLLEPIRIDILTALDEEVASPSQLSEKLNESLKRICHHIKFLEDRGAVELVRVAPGKAGIEHFYRATERCFIGDAEWKTLPKLLRGGISTVALRYNFADLIEALEAGTFDELVERHASRTRMCLDGQGVEDVTVLLLATLARLIEIGEEATNRLADSGEAGIHTKVHMLHFKSPSPGEG